VTVSQSYLPDDFGHDPELPATLQAMGIQATAFARLPGTWIDNSDASADPGVQLQAIELLEGNQIDFRWLASDGSSALAHWMARWYGRAGPEDVSSPAALAVFLQHPVGPQEEQGVGKTILEISPTQFAYVPCANDFQQPLTRLAETCCEWNERPPITSPKTVYCAAGTFDDFVGLVSSAGGLPTFGEPGRPFFSTPYFCGAQASRPRLKILHHRAVRALLAAESFAALAAGYTAPVRSGPAAVVARGPSELLLEAWNLLVPSTHHDYITGTAHPHVYRSEQLPLSRSALSSAGWLLDSAMADVASVLGVPARNESVAVFNALGAPRIVLAECDADAINAPSTTQVTCGTVTGPLQVSAEGNALFMADLPSLGCTSAFPAGGGAGASALDTVRLTSDSPTQPTVIKLANAQVEMVLTESDAWGISSCIDVSAKRELFPGGGANAIAIFDDGGTEYLLGCEQASGQFADSGVTQKALSVEVLESGPLRARVRVTTEGPAAVKFVREYALVAGEAMLRMRLTGSAPESSTVLVKLPLASSIATLTRGTPTHWTGQMPQLVWSGFTPYASHHFVLALDAADEPLAGILHPDIPAWGLMWLLTDGSWSNDGTLYGALLRNTSGSYYNWTYSGQPFPGGTDPDVHARSYALLVPSACGTAASGTPLLAALSHATPPTVSPLTGYLTPEDPQQGLSLAEASSPALVTAAKLGTLAPDALVLRLYQPTNAPLAGVNVKFDPRAVPGWSPSASVSARLITALEGPIEDAPRLTTTEANGVWSVSVDMPNAIATIALEPARRSPALGAS
jgi:alpha-mannosidase